MRNTSDLSKTLSVIRDHVIQQRSQEFEPQVIKHIFPEQTPGHYIHGPKTVIHVLKNFNGELIYDIFMKELGRLCGDSNEVANGVAKKDVGIVYDRGLGEMKPTDNILRRIEISLKSMNIQRESMTNDKT